MNDPKTNDAISRSELIKILREWPERLGILDNPTCEEYAERYGNLEALSAILGEVERLPTLDVVPVVRCKDCAHWKPCEVKGFEGHMYCEWAGWLVGKNAYCAYGEVKNDD